MSKFKVGDEVILVRSRKNPDVLKNGVTGVVLDLNDYPYIQFNVDEDSSLHNACGLGDKGKCYSVKQDELELITNQYKKSNRNKLREHIKSLGFTAIDLSVAAGFSKYYFGSETSESRFNKRGDISDKRFNELKALASSAKDKLSSKSIGKLTVDLEVKTTFVSDQSKELIEKLPENKPEKIKSKWIVSNKVFFTFVFIVSLLILFIATGVIKQVF